jgi:hypothetical protein
MASVSGELVSAAAILAFVLLAALLVLLGSRFRGLAGPSDTAAFRLAVSGFAGVLGLHLLLTGFDLVHVPWSRLSILGGLGAAAALAHRFSSRAGRPARVRAPYGWGDCLALLALAVFAFFAVSLAVTTPDFVFHWGLKGERFFLARATDYAYMARPWNWVIRPDYPNLVPELYAVTALVGGAFAPPAQMLWSVAFFALLLVAARETLQQAGVGSFVLQATLGTTGLIAAAAGIAGNMAGGGDWMIAAALAAAMPPLLRPADRSGSLQVGLAAALAAASKTEGVLLAAILIFVQGVRVVVWRRTEWRHLDVRAAAALVLPAAAVVLPWQVYLHHYHLLSQVNIGGVHLEYAHGIGQALGYELTADRTWHGFSWCLFLIPLLALRSRLRPVAAVIALQLLFYLYVYFSFPYDPVPLVITSFERLQLHLLPAILVAAGIALEPPAGVAASSSATVGAGAPLAATPAPPATPHGSS